MRQENPRYLEATLLPAQSDDVLELDEVWSFVGSKKRAIWLWVALCRRTRQVVAWYWGDRSAVTCGALWNKIPNHYKHAFCYSDFWEAYQKVIPKEQHQACAKQEGHTNHIERFNLTLRQRIGRLTRKTLSFSKSVLMHLITMHLITLRLFLVIYNQQKAKQYRSNLMAN
jgi:IS1 family transposase